MSLTVSTVRSWNPAALHAAADELDAARRVTVEATDDLRSAARSVSSSWSGEAADAAVYALGRHTDRGEHLEQALSLLRRSLRACGDAFTAAQALLADAVEYAASRGLTVLEDGSVFGPPAYIVPSTWSPQQAQAAHDEHQELAEAARRAQAMARQALAAAREADEDTARALRLAWSVTADGSGSDASDLAMVAAIEGREVPTAGTSPVEVSAWWSSLSPTAQALMLGRRWADIGNLDGIPYDVRVRANTTAITHALADARTRADDLQARVDALSAQLPQPGQINPGSRGYPDPSLLRELAELQTQLVQARAEEARYDALLTDSVPVFGPDGTRELVAGHQVVIFDPANGRFAEITGSIGPGTQNVAVLLGGTGTNEANMAGQYERAQSFVEAARPQGSLAVITYLGGPMPQEILSEAPLGRFAVDQAGALRDFVAGLDKPDTVPVTVVGHSYGGSVVGAAEAAGMVADRILHVESAGAGPNVFSTADYADPSTPRYSMTAPGDIIATIQGAQIGPVGHGADPDMLDNVVRLETGRADDSDPYSSLLEGPSSHSAVFTEGSTAWRNILAVMQGGEASLYTEPEVHVFANGTPRSTIITEYPMENPDFVPPTVDIR